MTMKESMDAFDIMAVVNELKEFEGEYIKKIYQKNDEIFIKLKKDIFIKNGKWICITKHREEMEYPPTFAMVLRKYLGNGIIKKIYQYDFDRIIIIEVAKEKIYRLIIELIPNGNVILVDENNIIINSLFQQKWSRRIIKPNREYVFPPSKKNPFELSFEEFKEIFKEKDAVRAIVKNLGIGGKWAEEICSMAGIDKKTPVDKLDEEKIKKLYDSMQNILEKFRKNDIQPVIIDSIDILPFPISKYEKMPVKKFSSMNEALDEFYFNFLFKKDEETEEEKGRIIRQINQQKEAIKKFIEMEKKFRKEADAIFSNFEKVDDAIKKRDFVEFNYPKAVIELSHGNEKLSVEIDINKSAIENAQEKYDASKKLREKIERAKIAIEKSRKMAGEVNKTKIKKSREKKFWFENYRWFISSEGNLVIGGKDAKSNEKIVKKYMKDDDIYVHADVHGAPSCIIKARDIEGNKLGIKEKTLNEACQFAVVYSKAWKQFAFASAYWVYPQQVSKKAESGEFIPKGAFIIRGKRNYMKCKMEFGIGIVEIKGAKKVMAAPPEAIKKYAERWIIFEPGEEDKNNFAKKIANAFKMPVSSVLSALPSGGFRKKEEK